MGDQSANAFLEPGKSYLVKHGPQFPPGNPERWWLENADLTLVDFNDPERKQISVRAEAVQYTSNEGKRIGQITGLVPTSKGVAKFQANFNPVLGAGTNLQIR